MEETLKKYYYNPEYGLKSASAFHKTLNNELNIKVSLKKVKDFVNKQEVNQIHKPVKKAKTNYPIIGSYHEYQADLMFLTDRKTIGLCNVVHINSRKLFTFTITEKSNLANKFEKLVTDNKIRIEILRTDGGGEFKSDFHAKMESMNITHILTPKDEKNKMYIVERLNGTIRNRIERWITSSKSSKYTTVLDDIVKNYNNTNHSGIYGLTPNEVFGSKTLEDYVISKKKSTIVSPPKLSLGDKVRIYEKKESAIGHQNRNYSKEIYTIVKVNAKSYRVARNGQTLDARYQYNQLLKIDESHELNPDGNLAKELSRRKYTKRNKQATNRLSTPTTDRWKKQQARKKKAERQRRILS